MTANEYQGAAARTAPADRDMFNRLSSYCLGLVGESGEVIDHIKKVLYHGHPVKKSLIREEVGDVLWYLANILSEFGIELEGVMIDNISKLKQRYPEGFSEERSRSRYGTAWLDD